MSPKIYCNISMSQTLTKDKGNFNQSIYLQFIAIKIQYVQCLVPTRIRVQMMTLAC